MTGGYRLMLALLALAWGCSSRDITRLNGTPSGGADAPVGNGTGLDSDLPGGGDVPGNSTPPTAGTTASCSDPMHGSRYVLCSGASVEAARTPGEAWMDGAVGSNLDEIKGLKYRVKGSTLYAIH
jgi:hypothetical protein